MNWFVSARDKIHDGWETVSYTDTCTGSKYVSKTCYDDNGNGSKSSRECGGNESYTYSCQKTRQEEKYHFVPHYDQWYWYDIERWVEIDRRNSFGEDHEPYFDSISPVGEKQRRIESLGTYTVNFSCDEPGPFSKDYDLSDWKLFKQDVPYEIEVNPVHSIISYPIPIPAVLP